MYLAHWGLERTPFDPAPDPGMWVDLDSRIAPAAKLRHGLVHAGAALLTGPRGAGKTRLARRALDDFREAGWKTVYLPSVSLSPADVRASVFGEADAGVDAGGRSEFGRLADALINRRAAGGRTLLAVDDVETADPETVAFYRALANVVAADAPAVAMLYIGREEPDLPPEALAPWRLAAGTICRAPLLDPAETRHYLLTRLKRAGMERPMLTRSAANRMADFSRGRLSDLNRLADLALVAGFGAGAEKITPDLVEMAAADLGLASGPVLDADVAFEMPPPSFSPPVELDVLASLEAAGA